MAASTQKDDDRWSRAFESLDRVNQRLDTWYKLQQELRVQADLAAQEAKQATAERALLARHVAETGKMVERLQLKAMTVGLDKSSDSDGRERSRRYHRRPNPSDREREWSHPRRRRYDLGGPEGSRARSSGCHRPRDQRGSLSENFSEEDSVPVHHQGPRQDHKHNPRAGDYGGWYRDFSPAHAHDNQIDQTSKVLEQLLPSDPLPLETTTLGDGSNRDSGDVRGSRNNNLGFGGGVTYHSQCCYSCKDEGVDPTLLHEGTAQPVFDKMPVKEVLSDGELCPDLNSHDDLLRQLAQGSEFISVRENVKESYLPPYLSDVVWDEILLDKQGLHGVSLEQKCTEYLVAEKNKSNANPMLDETPMTDVIWDEDLWDGHSLQGVSLEQLVESAEYMVDDGLLFSHGLQGYPLEKLVERGEYLVGDDLEPLFDSASISEAALAGDCCPDAEPVFDEQLFDSESINKAEFACDCCPDGDDRSNFGGGFGLDSLNGLSISIAHQPVELQFDLAIDQHVAAGAVCLFDEKIEPAMAQLKCGGLGKKIPISSLGLKKGDVDWSSEEVWVILTLQLVNRLKGSEVWHFILMEQDSVGDEVLGPGAVETLWQDYRSVFSTQTELPLARLVDRYILLWSGAIPRVYYQGKANMAADALSCGGHLLTLSAVSSAQLPWIPEVINFCVSIGDAQTLWAQLSIRSSNEEGFRRQQHFIRNRNMVWLGTNTAIVNRAATTLSRVSQLMSMSAVSSVQHSGIQKGTNSYVLDAVAQTLLAQLADKSPDQAEFKQFAGYSDKKMQQKRGEWSGHNSSTMFISFLQTMGITALFFNQFSSYQYFSPGYFITHIMIKNIPSWCYGGFSPGLCEHHYKLFMAVVWQWDPGITNFAVVHTYEISCSLPVVQNSVMMLIPLLVLKLRSLMLSARGMLHGDLLLPAGDIILPESERGNNCLDMYLRCAVHSTPIRWYSWLALAEFCDDKSVDDILQELQDNILFFKQHLATAQNRMKHFADKARLEGEFQLKQFHSNFGLPDLVNLETKGVVPEAVLEGHLIKEDNGAVPQVLIQWSGVPRSAATWKTTTSSRIAFLTQLFGDKQILRPGEMSQLLVLPRCVC